MNVNFLTGLITAELDELKVRSNGAMTDILTLIESGGGGGTVDLSNSATLSILSNTLGAYSDTSATNALVSAALQNPTRPLGR